MKTSHFAVAAGTLAVAALALAEGPPAGLDRPLDAAEVAEALRRAADWQLAHPNRTDLRDWVIAPFYDGLIELSKTTGEPRFLAEVVRMGTQSGWMPGTHGGTQNAAYFADNHAVGHAWIDIYLMDPSKQQRLGPMRQCFDGILAKPVTEKLVFGTKPTTPGTGFTDRWTWSDALYMAPPTLARLANATGDARYLDFLDAEYKATCDDLLDPADSLFYRDGRFITRKSPNGKKVMWGRGNGWVFAGLPLVLDALPAGRPSRTFYTDLFRKMAAAVVALQQPDGLWTPSLLDPQDVAVGETSGSAFFVYGLAWGVNHGLLDRETYWPVVVRGWNALLTRVSPDGRVGYVQGIGESPAKVGADSTQLYGTGAVLLAGSEILRGLGAAKSVEPAALLARAEKLVADDTAPRAYARLLPERKDDLAWENDKAVYRIYGPALRSGPEASGIDAWAKKVARPVIDRWYADDLAGRQSYHENHGEGYDGYKVGDSLGCGGTALWHDDKLVNADVYDQAEVLFTKRDVAEMRAFYTYPAVDGVVYKERRLIRLRMGECLNEVVARFTRDNKPAARLKVAVGLVAQTPGAELTLDAERGVLAVWDTLQPAGDAFGIGAVVPAGSMMLRQPHTTTEPKADHALAILQTDERGEIRYRAGFGWPGGDVPTATRWIEHLAAAKLPAAPPSTAATQK